MKEAKDSDSIRVTISSKEDIYFQGQKIKNGDVLTVTVAQSKWMIRKKLIKG